METVTISEVSKNDRGWYEILIEEDDRKLATKERTLADTANASIGKPVQVDVNESQNGKFTNYFLNGIETNGSLEGGSSSGSRNRLDTSAAPVKAEAKAKTPAKDIEKPSVSQNATQERIARQWAFGRATELLAASNATFDYPIDDKTFGYIEAVAKRLLTATSE